MSEIETLSLLFDSAWYLATYQDVTLANCDPLDHYLSFGYKEGRNPNRFFDTHFYLTTYPDIQSCHLNPFIHYILYGASEGRLPRAPNQAPLPAITFDVFLDEDSEEAVETELSPDVEQAIEKLRSNVEDKEDTVLVDPPKVATKKEEKPAPKAKKTVRKPAPQTKATALTSKRKKVIKA